MNQLQSIAAQWPAPSNVCAFTTTRIGGYSRGPYRGLNLGSHVGDAATIVAKNRSQLVNCLPSEPVWLDQVHGNYVLEIASAMNRASSTTGQRLIPPVADGAISGVAGVVCAVMTADCLPLMLCDLDATQVAAVHVGWRGLEAGIVEQALSKFIAPANNILAWAGPCIGAKNFAVGAEVKAALGGPAAAYQPAAEEDKYYADLYQLVGARLAACGVGDYAHAEHCTYAEPELFYSYRRTQTTGRMASVIYFT